MNMKKQNLVFLDLETTGLDLTKHEIIEVGFIVTTPRLKVIEELEMKIKPERIQDADPVSLKISHYNEDDWRDSISLKEAIKIISEKTKDCILIGQNVAFDSGFLDVAFSKMGIQNSMNYHKLDTISIAWTKLHKNRKVKSFSLREMCLYFGIKNEKAHTALSDARATFEVYKKLMKL